MALLWLNLLMESTPCWISQNADVPFEIIHAAARAPHGVQALQRYAMAQMARHEGDSYEQYRLL